MTDNAPGHNETNRNEQPQLTISDLEYMTTNQINSARRGGQLDTLLIGNTNEQDNN